MAASILEPRADDVMRVGDMDDPRPFVVYLNDGSGDVRLRISTAAAGGGTLLLDTLLRTPDGIEVGDRHFEVWPEALDGLVHGGDLYLAVRRRADGSWSSDVHVTVEAAPVDGDARKAAQ